MTRRTVHVVRTRNVAQGMAALVAFDPMKDPAENAKVMADVAQRAHGIVVTRAANARPTSGVMPSRLPIPAAAGSIG